MPKGQDNKQTDETDMSKLMEMAKREIESGKVKYCTIFETGKEAELYKIRCWIRDHSPQWRSNGWEMIVKEMKRLGIS